MAVTGLIMIAFLLMHMYGNLKAFMGAEAFDHYAHWLKSDILYPILPKHYVLWGLRLGLHLPACAMALRDHIDQRQPAAHALKLLFTVHALKQLTQ